jgi:hypothetical protein
MAQLEPRLHALKEQTTTSRKHICDTVREEDHQRHATIEVSKLLEVDSVDRLSAAIGIGGCQRAVADIDSVDNSDVYVWVNYQVVDEWLADEFERDSWAFSFLKGPTEVHWLKSPGWLTVAFPPPPSDGYLVHIQDAATWLADKRPTLPGEELSPSNGGHLAVFAYTELTSRAEQKCSSDRVVATATYYALLHESEACF